MLKIAEKCPPGTDKKTGKCKEAPCKKTTGVTPFVSIKVSDTNDGEMLLCSECRHIITSTVESIEVHGAYNHSFANPHGLFFEIGCYKNAPGCFYSNDASTEFTWFIGFSWRAASCQGCMSHIGWLFTSAASHFHGLISERLVIARSDDA